MNNLVFFPRLFKEFSEVIKGILPSYTRNFPKLFKEFFEVNKLAKVIQGIFLGYSRNFHRFLGLGIGSVADPDDF